MTKYTIIAIYYQGVTSDEDFLRFIDSVHNQTFKDYELLIYHDGPLLRPVPNNIPVKITETRRNVFGHNLRRIGLEQASGEFILHTNCDNVYNTRLLEQLEEYTKDNEVIIGLAKMMGLEREGRKVWYSKPRDYSKFTYLNGDPPIYGNIDLMQTCISKNIWNKYGWFSLHECSDGFIYQKICQENKYINTRIIFGEHY